MKTIIINENQYDFLLTRFIILKEQSAQTIQPNKKISNNTFDITNTNNPLSQEKIKLKNPLDFNKKIYSVLRNSKINIPNKENNNLFKNMTKSDPKDFLSEVGNVLNNLGVEAKINLQGGDTLGVSDVNLIFHLPKINASVNVGQGTVVAGIELPLGK